MIQIKGNLFLALLAVAALCFVTAHANPEGDAAPEMLALDAKAENEAVVPETSDSESSDAEEKETWVQVARRGHKASLARQAKKHQSATGVPLHNSFAALSAAVETGTAVEADEDGEIFYDASDAPLIPGYEDDLEDIDLDDASAFGDYDASIEDLYDGEDISDHASEASPIVGRGVETASRITPELVTAN